MKVLIYKGYNERCSFQKNIFKNNNSYLFISDQYLVLIGQLFYFFLIFALQTNVSTNHSGSCPSLAGATSTWERISLLHLYSGGRAGSPQFCKYSFPCFYRSQKKLDLNVC